MRFASLLLTAAFIAPSALATTEQSQQTKHQPATEPAPMVAADHRQAQGNGDIKVNSASAAGSSGGSVTVGTRIQASTQIKEPRKKITATAQGRTHNVSSEVGVIGGH